MLNIFLGLYAILKIIYFLNIYQQSHYKIKVYSIYFLSNIIYNNLFIFLLMLIAYFLNNTISDIIVGIYLLIYASLFYRKRRKGLNFTNRIIRQLIVLVIFIIASLWISYSEIKYPIFIFLEFVSIPLLWFMNGFECLNSQKYIKRAKNKLDKYEGLVIAITGSFGKTSTKHYLGKILNIFSPTFYTEKSFNTPLGIARNVNNNEISLYDNLVLEFGAAKKNDISYLCEKYKHQVGILTSIGHMHLDTFKTIENIVHEKTRIIELLDRNGVGFINVENEFIRNYHFSTKATLISYGINFGDYQAKNIVEEEKLDFDVFYKGEYLCHLQSKLLGEHNVINLLLCIAYCHYFRFDLEKAVREIALLNNVENRLSIKYYDDYIMYDDAFNANINGALSALKLLKNSPGKRFLITPGFVEMKKKAKEINARFVKAIAESCDVCILVGIAETKDLYQDLIKLEINLLVADDIFEAFKMFHHLKENKSYLLVENDLPDLYLRRRL